MMRAGLLTSDILFEKRKEKRNFFGEEEIHWHRFKSAKAHVKENTGVRLVENGENIVSYTKEFTIRSYPGCLINEDMRIRFDNRHYRINSIIREKDVVVIHATYWNV